MNIKPFEDYILVRPLEVKDSKPKGIVLPEKSKNMFKVIIAKVEAIGEGRLLDCGLRRPMDVKLGQHVMFSMQAPAFPISETALWQANMTQLPNLILINIGHLMGTVTVPKDVELQPAQNLSLVGADA